MSSSSYGTLAALGSPLMMTVGFIVWDEHWKGSAFALNMFKCSLASVGFLILSFATRPHGTIFPSHTVRPIYFLIMSSVCGILLGDLLWLEGLRLLGARRVVVVDSIKPFLAAMLGWAILNEKLVPTAFIGMAVTVVGVLVVSLEKESAKTKETTDDDVVKHLEVVEASCNEVKESRNAEESASHSPNIELNVDDTESDSPRTNSSAHLPLKTEEGNVPSPSTMETSKRVFTPQSMRKGYLMACLNVVLDTYGSILTRQYGVGLTTWEINLVRFGFAGASLLVVAILFHLRDLVTRSPQYQKQKHRFLQRTGSGFPDLQQSNSGSPSEANEPDDKVNNSEVCAKSSSPMPWYCLPNNMSQRSWIHVIIGVILVTFLAPTLSNYALFRIAVAIAITLGSVGPLYVLPLAYLMQHEKPTNRAVLGSLLAVGGIAMLAFWRE